MKLNRTRLAICGLLVAAPALFSAEQSNAKDLEFVPIVAESQTQKSVYSDGKPVVLSVLQNTALAISCERLGAEIWINLTAENGFSEAIDVDPMRLSVTAYREGKPDSPVEIYDPVKYVARLRRNQAWAVALGGVANSLNSQNAGNSYSTTTFSGVAGGRSFSGVATTESYDYSKDMAARQAQQQQLMQQAAAYRQSSDAMDAALLKRNTVPSNYLVGGTILCKYDRRAIRYKISVPLGSDIHNLTFDVVEK